MECLLMIKRTCVLDSVALPLSLIGPIVLILFIAEGSPECRGRQGLWSDSQGYSTKYIRRPLPLHPPTPLLPSAFQMAPEWREFEALSIPAAHSVHLSWLAGWRLRTSTSSLVIPDSLLKRRRKLIKAGGSICLPHPLHTSLDNFKIESLVEKF